MTKYQLSQMSRVHILKLDNVKQKYSSRHPLTQLENDNLYHKHSIMKAIKKIKHKSYTDCERIILTRSVS